MVRFYLLWRKSINVVVLISSSFLNNLIAPPSITNIGSDLVSGIVDQGIFTAVNIEKEIGSCYMLHITHITLLIREVSTEEVR